MAVQYLFKLLFIPMTTLSFSIKFWEIQSKLIDAKAEELGKSRCDLIPWTDYDPISIEYKARELAQGGGIMWTGD